LATDYTEITDKTRETFRVFRVFRGYLHDISSSEQHSGNSLIISRICIAEVEELENQQLTQELFQDSLILKTIGVNARLCLPLY
jgi:hypothetical protein